MKIKLGDLCTICSSKRIMEKEYTIDGVPFVRGLEVTNKTLLQDDARYECHISKERFDELKEKYGVPQIGDILITAVGTIGNLCYINKKKDFYFKDGNLIWFKQFKDVVYSKYLYYFMQSPCFKNQLNNLLIGAVQKALTMVMLSKIIIDLPDYSKQVEIADSIEKYDLKVENNNKIISQLESMAKTLYDYWFLQFEFPNEEGKPYKSSGGKMVYNEELKREIPEVWEVKTIGDLVIRNNKKFDYKSEQTNIDLSVMPSDSIAVNQFNSSEDFSTNLFVMNKGDILFGSIRPYLHKACIAPCMGTFAGTVYSYSVKENKDYNLVLTTLTRKSFFDYAESCCQGTKMPVVRNESILKYKLAYDSKIAKLFNDYINFKDSIPNMIMQNKELASLRDFLLPMLMNGQVTFKED